MLLLLLLLLLSLDCKAVVDNKVVDDKFVDKSKVGLEWLRLLDSFTDEVVVWSTEEDGVKLEAGLQEFRL